MNKLGTIILLLIAVGAGVFAWRHAVLRQLSAEHDRLQQQSQEVSNLHLSITQARETAATASTNIGLSSAERSELLRLRGEIGGLRRDLSRETNQPTRPSP